MDRGGSGFWVLVIHELCFEINWGLIIQLAVSAALVVPAFDADKEPRPGTLVIGRNIATQDLAFEFTDGTFHPGVVIGIGFATHAGDPAAGFQELPGGGAGVLNATIRMDQQTFTGPTLLVSHAQGCDDQIGSQMVAVLIPSSSGM